MTTTDRSGARRWWALIAVSLANFMCYLDNNVTNVALPTIQRSLHLSVAGLEWVVSSYLLVVAGLLLAGGRVADVYGRRRVFIIGLTVFTLSSLAAGLAGSGGVLIGARAVQGLGAALLMPTTLAIILATFNNARERTMAIGLWGAIGALALAAGPVIGGVISQHLHWGWIFLINVPVGIVTLGLGLWSIAESRAGSAVRRLDLPGLVTSALALFALTYALIEGQNRGWTSALIVTAFAVAVAALAAFLAIESRAEHPMVSLPIFRSREFSGGTGTMMIWAFGIFGIYFFTSLYLQVILGFSPTKAGLAFVPMALCIAVFSVLSSRVSAWLGAHRTVALGMAVMVVGLLLFARLGSGAGYASLMPGFVLFGAGAGLMNVPLTNAVMESAPSAQAGIASALFNASREVAGLLGVTVVGAVLRTVQASSIRSGSTAPTAFLNGYHAGLWVAIGLIAVGILLSYLALRPRPAPPTPPHGGSRVSGAGQGALWDDPVVTAPANEHEPPPIAFGNGNKARLAEGRPEDADAIIAGLGLEPATPTRPVIVVCGGAGNLAGAALERADALIGTGVALAAKTTGAAVVDGATDAGVMRLTGGARARRPQALPILVGVAPKGLVSYPGGPEPSHPGGPEQGQQRVPLEDNHTHFVLADSGEWGGETPLMMDVAQKLARGGPVAMVLAGGGIDGVARSEVQQAARRGWPVFVAAGTGGLADELARLWGVHRIRHRRRGAAFLPSKFRYREPTSPSAIADRDLREIITEADITPVDADVDPMQFARQLAWELQDEPTLKGAWQRFATYDALAVRLRRLFTRFQSWILLLGVVGTLLALIQSEVKQTWLHWVVVVVPILVSVLIAVVSRRAVGQRWVMMRAAAEFIKGEIYRYRALRPAQVRPADRQHLASQLDVIEARLMQTEASSGPVTPYHGPLPPAMYGAAGDDDGLSRLGADGYLRIRVDEQLSYFHGRVRALNRRRNALQFVSVASGATGAILAAASLETWIGLTAGLSAAALAYLGYLQVDNTIVTYNQTAFRLEALERGWRALDQSHQSRTALERLITNCEAALATEQAGWVQQMNDTLEHLRERQADETKNIAGQDETAGRPRHGDTHDAPAAPETT